MALTAKQEAFCQAMAGGMNQTEAYRSAYDTSGMADKTVWDEAYNLANHPEVSPKVKLLKDELAARVLWTREQSVAVLVDVIGDGESRGSDKISAVKVLNDMQGFNAPTKLEVSGKFEINVHFD